MQLLGVQKVIQAGKNATFYHKIAKKIKNQLKEIQFV